MTAIRKNGASSGIGVIGTIAYDNPGRRTSLTLGSGVATAHTYDAVSRLNDIKQDFAGTTDDLTAGFWRPSPMTISDERRKHALYSGCAVLAKRLGLTGDGSDVRAHPLWIE